MSNITSFDYRRKSLAELQKICEEQAKAIRELQERLSWQETYVESMEVSMNEVKSDHKFIADNILKEVKEIHRILIVGNK